MARDGGFAELRARLEAIGFRPSRKLGQNFLIDTNLAVAIAAEVPLTAADVVLEIGAGTGLLTRRLAARTDVVAVEIDSRLVGFLRDEIRSWGEAAGHVHLVEGDALVRGELAAEVVTELDRVRGSRPWACVSNLPYSVSGPCVAALICAASPPRDGLLLTQLEMAQRITAPPGGRDYGTLSILVALAYAPALVRRVPSDVFRPRPRVESALVRLGPARAWLAEPVPVRQGFARFLQSVFGGRRKVLRNALTRGHVDAEHGVAAAGLPKHWLRERAEVRAPEELFAVYRAVASME